MNLSPVQILTLARLLPAAGKGETEKNLIKDLKPLIEHRPGGADDLGRALEELESAGVVDRIKDRKGKLTAKRFLTAEGHRLALEALGIEALPPGTTWAKLKSTVLAALALGRPGRDVANLKAEILRSHYGLDLGDRPTMKGATEAMAAKLLGLEPGRPFNAENILRKLLADAGIEIPAGKKPGATIIQEALFRRELGEPSAGKPIDLLANRSVGARNNTAAGLVEAVLRTWIDRSEAKPAPIDLADFARRVAEAARESPTGWFGDDEVFIAHVWRALGDDPAFRGMGADAFKARLVEAHRARLLELGRADLVEAMDPADVRESATPYLNAVYHFVRTEEPAR